MSCEVSTFTDAITTKLHTTEILLRRRMLHRDTNPVMIYVYHVLIYDVLKSVDYFLLHPSVAATTLLIYAIDHCELWTRFALCTVQYFASFIRTLIFASQCLQTYASNIAIRGVQYFEDRLESVSSSSSSDANNVFSWSPRLRKCVTFSLQCGWLAWTGLHLFVTIASYLRIPLLMTMNKTNAFTIHVQHSEISLLRKKTHFLTEKNKLLAHHFRTMEKRKIMQYNILVTRTLHKCLHETLPVDLVNLIASFSFIMLDNDCIKIKYNHKHAMLRAAAHMDHKWIWNRFQAVELHRSVTRYERACWFAIYYLLECKTMIVSKTKQMLNAISMRTSMSKHALQIIFIQLLLLVFVIYCYFRFV